MILFRPVGLEELRLMYEADMRAFPPRLPDQPIFYPVTNEGYATQIAREWNTKSGTLAGFVTRFAVPDDYAAKLERRVVGAREHEELWVPAEDLDDFNARIDGRIEVVSAFFGDGYRGFVPDAFGLGGHDATSQLALLARTLDYSGMDFLMELAANNMAVFLNFFFWEQSTFAREAIDQAARAKTLSAIRKSWKEDRPSLGAAKNGTRSVELHDAGVLAIVEHDGNVLVQLEAFVYDDYAGDASPGGVWQRIDLLFYDGAYERRGEEVEAWTSIGTLTVDDHLYDNMLPILLDVTGATSLSLLGTDFLLTVRGSRVVLSVAGPPGNREG